MNARFMWLGSVACLASSAAFAQQPVGTTEASPATQSLTGVQLKGKAPVSTQTLTPKLPKPVEDRLANGLQIVLIEDHELPTFTMQLVIDRGSVGEAKGKEGLAQATASQLAEGTRTRSTEQTAGGLGLLGASVGSRLGLG